jgi:hypothetical protein
MEKAGIEPDKFRLAAFVSQTLRDEMDHEKAVLAIGAELIRDKELLRAAVLELIAMARNEKDGGTGQESLDNQWQNAPSPSAPLLAKGRPPSGAQIPCADPRQANEGGGGQQRCDTQFRHASPPSPIPAREPSVRREDSSGGQHPLGAHPFGAPAAVAKVIHPEPRRGATAIAAMQRTIQDGWLLQYRVPNGPTAMRTPISQLAPLRRRLMRETGDHFHGLVVLRALEIATSRYAEANPNVTAADVLTREEIAGIEATTSYDVVKLKAADWIRKYPELETADAE